MTPSNKLFLQMESIDVIQLKEKINEHFQSGPSVKHTNGFKHTTALCWYDNGHNTLFPCPHMPMSFCISYKFLEYENK